MIPLPYFYNFKFFQSSKQKDVYQGQFQIVLTKILQVDLIEIFQVLI